MTLQQLSYVLAATKHGSFSAAADALHMAQPSLSEQVRRLEDELGVALFRRVGRGLVPTEAGLTLRDHAERVLQDVDAARDAVAEGRDLRGGTATFGIFGQARVYPITPAVAEFRRRHPGVRLRLVGLNSAEVADAVRAGELEVGMVALPVDDRGLEVRPLIRDEFVYVSADPARLKHAQTIEDVAAAPLVMYDASYRRDDPMRRQLNQTAQQAGITLLPEVDVEDLEMAVELAAAGVGDTLLSRGVILTLGDRMPAGLGWVPFLTPIYDHIAVVQRRGVRPSPASREFLSLAEAQVLALAAELETRPPRRRLPGA